MIRTTLMILLAAGTLQAQPVRTWVSSTIGSDFNPCSKDAPCRTFGAAINLVQAGGEVVVLDSGGFGQVVINQSVTILSPAGTHGAIAPTAGDAITVDGDPSTIIVNLRGLYLNGQGAASGISVTQAKAVHVEDCVINGFAEAGVDFQTLGTSEIYLLNTIIRNNGAEGVTIRSTGGTARGLIDGCRLEWNLGDGVAITDAAKFVVRNTFYKPNIPLSRGVVARGLTAGAVADVVVEDSAFFGGGSHVGVSVEAVNGEAHMMVNRTVITNCVAGIRLDGANTSVRVSDSSVVHNMAGASAFNQGVLETRGNNAFNNNNVDFPLGHATYTPQ